MPPCDSGVAVIPDNRYLYFRVSILVLVDAALRLEGATYRIGKVPGFNPCFSGCRPATLLQCVQS